MDAEWHFQVSGAPGGGPGVQVSDIPVSRPEFSDGTLHFRSKNGWAEGHFINYSFLERRP